MFVSRLVALASTLIANIRFLFDGKLRLNKIPHYDIPASGLVEHPMQASVQKALEYPLGGVSVLWGPGGSGKSTMAALAASAHASNGHYVAMLVSHYALIAGSPFTSANFGGIRTAPLLYSIKISGRPRGCGMRWVSNLQDGAGASTRRSSPTYFQPAWYPSIKIRTQRPRQPLSSPTSTTSWRSTAQRAWSPHWQI